MYSIYTIIILFVLPICLCLINFLRDIKRIRNGLKVYPGPKPIPILGNAHEFFNNDGMLKVFCRWNKTYGKIMKGQSGPFHDGLLVSDYRFTKKFLLGNTNLSKGPIYDMTKSWLGRGLLTSGGDEWKIQRKILSPAFSMNLLTDFIKVFDEQSNVLVEKFKEKLSLDSVNIHEFLSLCSLDIICETTMGTSINAQKSYSEYVSCIREMCEIISNRIMSLWKIPPIVFFLTYDHYRQRKCLKIIRSYTNRIITARKQQRKMEKNENQENDEFGGKKKLALLDVLLEYSENEKLSQKEIEEQVHTFMFAGHDTVSATMDFVIYELSKNPKIQELVFEEQKEIFGNNLNKEIKLEHLQQMKYLDAVIKETLRLYPPVSVIGRSVTEYFEFENHVVPEGASIVFLIYVLHRDPEYFPNPEVFDPSRFEDTNAIDPFSFIPFSTGPRNCIGQKFALFEMKVILSKLIRNFKISSTSPPHLLDLKAEIVLTSKNGVKVKLSPRNR